MAMRKFLPALFALSLLGGCATHRLVAAHPNPYGEPHRVSSVAFGWGALQKRTVATCDNSLLDEVRVKQNFGQSLLTVLTLGIVMPTTIEYICAKTPVTPAPSTDN
jgi:Bor protein